MSFRDNLLHLRASSNMTQEQLAMLLGVSRQSVTKWESERTYPEMDKLLKMCRIFDCSLDDLVQGDLTGTEPRPAAANAGAPPTDVFGYDEIMSGFAQRVTNGIMVIVLGVAISVAFFAGGQNGFYGPWLTENLGVTLGVLCVFIGAIAGSAFIIPAALQRAAFMRAHPFIEDFYTEEEKARARTTFTYEFIGGVAILCLGICAIIFLDGSAYQEPLGIPALIACIAVGVRFIVHGVMTLGRTNIEEYNESALEMIEPEDIEKAAVSEERKRKMLETRRMNKRIGTVCGVIMIIATIVALLMLFLPFIQGDPDYTHGPVAYFWLTWPIGGLLCGIACLLIKGFAKQ